MEKSNTFFGISLLRIIATFSVIMIHVSGPIVVKYGKVTHYDWHVANFFDSISRYSVPVFFMISGALLLGRTIEFKDFLKNRLGKIIPPFLFWSLLYSLCNRYYFNNESFTISKVIKDVFYGSEYHLWFIYTLFGIYLFTPLLQKWIHTAKKNEIEYYLFIWIISLFITIPGIFIYFPKVNLQYFSGFLGYFILGYYLKKYIKCSKSIALLLILIGITITIFATYYFSFKINKFQDYFYEYLSINSLLVAVGVFLLFFNFNTNSESVKKALTIGNECSFGIFLIHPLVLHILALNGLNGQYMNPLIGIILTTCVCFLISFIVIFFIKKIKFGHLIA